MEAKCAVPQANRIKVMEDEVIKKGIQDVMSYIGDDPQREGLLDTPDRVVRSWAKLYGGYAQDPADILKTVFQEGSCREMVGVKDVE